MGAQARDRVARSDDDPALRTTEQLVAAHHDEGRALGDRVARGELAGEAPRREIEHEAAAEVVEQRHAGLGGDQREVAHAGFGDEAFLREVAPVHLDDGAGAR